MFLKKHYQDLRSELITITYIHTIFSSPSSHLLDLFLELHKFLIFLCVLRFRTDCLIHYSDSKLLSRGRIFHFPKAVRLVVPFHFEHCEQVSRGALLPHPRIKIFLTVSIFECFQILGLVGTYNRIYWNSFNVWTDRGRFAHGLCVQSIQKIFLKIF